MPKELPWEVVEDGESSSTNVALLFGGDGVMDGNPTVAVLSGALVGENWNLVGESSPTNVELLLGGDGKTDGNPTVAVSAVMVVVSAIVVVTFDKKVPPSFDVNSERDSRENLSAIPPFCLLG